MEALTSRTSTRAGIARSAALPPAYLPPWARFESHPGGAWRRARLHLALRLMAKRMRTGRADIPLLRAKGAAFDLKFAQPDPARRSTRLAGDGVPAEWIDVPESRPDRVLLYLHGGAFLFRFPNLHATLAARWARPLRARILMVDYRLAPEHPYPAAPDDCHAAYRWLLAQGASAKSIVIAGDSAGGNLALVTLQRIKAATEPLPACAVVLSPVVDFTLSGASLLTNERSDPMFTLAGLLAMRSLYARPEHFLDISISPLFGDWRGLPPLLFQAGDIEVLRDESVRAAERARAAGVDVELEIWDRMAHVFQALALLPQSALAAERCVRFIAKHTGWYSA